MNKLGFSLMLLLCSGCASVYKAPTNGPTALLELDSNVLPVLVQHFADEQCTRDPSGIRLAFLAQTFGEPIGTTKTIAANQQFVITFRWLHFDDYLPVLWECASTSSFYPQAGVTYRAIFHNENATCYISILRKEIRGEIARYEPEESYRNLKKTCFNNKG